MNLEVINRSKIKINAGNTKKQLAWILGQLKKAKVKNQEMLKLNLMVVFVTRAEIKKLNQLWRGKGSPTDILSFQGVTGEDIGELVICPQVLKKQAKEHELRFEDELVYMLIHGVLHLLGYDHERRQIDAKKMFAIQDKIFEGYLSR